MPALMERPGYIHEKVLNKALDYCHLVGERVLVDVCLHCMLEECRIFLENLSFSFFSKLMEEPIVRTIQCTEPHLVQRVGPT